MARKHRAYSMCGPLRLSGIVPSRVLRCDIRLLFLVPQSQHMHQMRSVLRRVSTSGVISYCQHKTQSLQASGAMNTDMHVNRGFMSKNTHTEPRKPFSRFRDIFMLHPCPWQRSELWILCGWDLVLGPLKIGLEHLATS